MIKRIIQIILVRAYSIAKVKIDEINSKQRDEELNRNATIGKNVIVTEEAIFQNSNNDKTRIIIGDNCFIRGFFLTYKHGGQIVVGNDCFIGSSSKIWSAKRIKIGNRVLISHNVNIHDNNSHPLNSIERHKDFIHITRNGGFQERIDLNEREIIIEDDAWIGFNSTVLKGVRIGKGAIVGAGCVITHDIPPYAVVVGNPLRIVKYVD